MTDLKNKKSAGEKVVDRSNKKESRMRDVIKIMVHKPTCLLGMIMICLMVICIFLAEMVIRSA